jgi:hypothetical protein
LLGMQGNHLPEDDRNENNTQHYAYILLIGLPGHRTNLVHNCYSINLVFV